MRGSGRPVCVRTEGFGPRKGRALSAFRSQLATTGDPAEAADDAAGLTPSFLANFTGGREIFFPILHGSPGSER